MLPISCASELACVSAYAEEKQHTFAGEAGCRAISEQSPGFSKGGCEATSQHGRNGTHPLGGFVRNQFMDRTWYE
jgi:hypothetical protein